MLLAENMKGKSLWRFEKCDIDLEKYEVKLLDSDESHVNHIYIDIRWDKSTWWTFALQPYLVSQVQVRNKQESELARVELGVFPYLMSTVVEENMQGFGNKEKNNYGEEAQKLSWSRREAMT